MCMYGDGKKRKQTQRLRACGPAHGLRADKFKYERKSDCTNVVRVWNTPDGSAYVAMGGAGIQSVAVARWF